MICDPAVIATFGIQPESDYPYPVGANDDPEPIYCVGGEPGITPHGGFRATHSAYDSLLITPGSPSFLRLFYAPRANNQADAINLENDTAYTMQAMAFVTTNQIIQWDSADFTEEDEGWIVKHGITVMETVIGGTPLAPYSSVYGALNSSPVTPTLEVTHSWDGTWDKVETVNAWAYGLLPPLVPGAAYRAEPFMFVKARVLGDRDSGTVGGYQNGRMYFGMVGWSDHS